MMDGGDSPIPAQAGIPVIVEETGWRRTVARAEAVAVRAAQAAGADDLTIVLSGNAAVRRLNARHRGIDKPTNVLTFEPAGPGLPGEIVLALGVVKREAAAAGRAVADHLAHLVVHGVLHLQGHDHEHPGDARRMEMAEAVILSRIGVPNPWRAGR